MSDRARIEIGGRVFEAMAAGALRVTDVGIPDHVKRQLEEFATRDPMELAEMTVSLDTFSAAERTRIQGTMDQIEMMRREWQTAEADGSGGCRNTD